MNSINPKSFIFSTPSAGGGLNTPPSADSSTLGQSGSDGESDNMWVYIGVAGAVGLLLILVLSIVSVPLLVLTLVITIINNIKLIIIIIIIKFLQLCSFGRRRKFLFQSICNNPTLQLGGTPGRIVSGGATPGRACANTSIPVFHSGIILEFFSAMGLLLEWVFPFSYLC